MGKLRSQSRAEGIRTLYLCDECFERLPAHQLNDLFLRELVHPVALTESLALELAPKFWSMRSRRGRSWRLY